MPKIYLFDEKKFYKTEIDALLDQVATEATGENQYLMASNGTFTPIPELPIGKVAKYNAENDDWDLVDEKKKYIVDNKIVEVWYYQDVDVSGWTEYSDEAWTPIELQKKKEDKITQRSMAAWRPAAR